MRGDDSSLPPSQIGLSKTTVNHSIEILDKMIASSRSVKLLGLTSGNKLIFDIHINDICYFIRLMANAKLKGLRRIHNASPNVNKNWQIFNLIHG